MWSRAVACRGTAPFLTFITGTGDSNTWSYRQFAQLVGLTAQRFRALGVAPGTAVHLNLASSPAFIMSWLACASLGAVTVASDPEAEVPALLRELSGTHPVLGIVGLRRRWTYRNAVSRSATPEFPVIEVSEDEPDTLAGSPLFTPGPVFGAVRRRDSAGRSGHPPRPAAGSRAAERPRPCGPTAAAAGSLPESVPIRALPAGALSIVVGAESAHDPTAAGAHLLTHADGLSEAHEAAAAAGLGQDHRWLITGDLHTLAAQARELTAVITAGATVVLAARFAPAAWLEQVRTHAVTHTCLTADRAREVLGDEFAGEDDESAGEDLDRLAARTGVRIGPVASDPAVGTTWALAAPDAAVAVPAGL